MNILTFDIEEWFIEKNYHGGRSFRYQQFDETFAKVLDELDRLNIKATFFCIGKMALDFPEVVKAIATRGHEVGCHSNEHIWLNKMEEHILLNDTKEALKALEDVSGQKVVSYRAPAFSITQYNTWVINVLADCGIKSDASVFPASRDFGGYPSFPYDTPCIISYQGSSIKEYPIGLMSILGKKVAYSGGGFFRLIPSWLVNRTMKNRDYNICYFHLNDLIRQKLAFKSKVEYEEMFKEPGTLKNRLVRYAKSNVGTSNAFVKFEQLLSMHQFVNIQEADVLIDWEKVKTVSL